MAKQKHNDKLTDEEIIKLFNEYKKIGLISSITKIPHVSIWRRLKKLGLKSESKGGSKISLQEILNGEHPYYQTFKLKNRLLKENILENKCSICNITEWNYKPINMQLDHIDGDSTNHTLCNLRMICPNCHSQTETYCGKNK